MKNDKYKFHYEVESCLWKDPFDKSVTDEIEFAKHERANEYHEIKHFDDANPLVARYKAVNYFKSMIDVLCESVGKPYENYWKAVSDLQPLFRADHPLAHKKIGNFQFDDDITCGVSLTMRVEHGNKKDRLNLLDLGIYDDNMKYELFTGLVYSLVEQGRECDYYYKYWANNKDKNFDLDFELEVTDLYLNDIGIPEHLGIVMFHGNLHPDIIDWVKFLHDFKGNNINELPDADWIMDRYNSSTI